MPTQDNPGEPDPMRGLTLPVSKKGAGCPFDPEVLKHATHIDRRTCKRVVPLKILVLGLSRTGTVSLRHALFELGYFDVYHGSSFCNENPRDAEMWTEALQGKFEGAKPFERADWDQLFGHCMAVSDTPSYAFADDLIRAYPDAKVILTLRDSPAAWKRSMMSTVVPSAEANVNSSAFKSALMALLPKSPLTAMFKLAVKHTRLLEIPQRGEAMYEEHNDLIRSLVPPAHLLEYNVKQGWEPLCRFLGKPIPSTSFPRVNSEEQYLATVGSYQQRLLFQALSNLALYVVPLALAAGAIGYTFWTF